LKDKSRIRPIRWAFLAGLVDGDGSITIKYDKESGYQLSLAVYSTNRIVMNWLVHVFGGQYRKMPTNGNRKQKYCWYTYNDAVVTNLSPHLIIKKEQGQVANQFISLGSERLPEARQDRMRDLQLHNNTFQPLSKEAFMEAEPVPPTKIDYAYLAGLFDAEGSFSIYKRKIKGQGMYSSAARLSNTDGIVFPWLASRFGGYFSITKRKNRDEGTWTMTGQNRELNMLAILPYLVIKKQRAAVVLEWMRHNRTFTPEQKMLSFMIMQKLNKRGISPEANTLRPRIIGAKTESDPYGDIGREPAVMLAS
jgi:hypothetical protein